MLGCYEEVKNMLESQNILIKQDILAKRGIFFLTHEL